MPGMRGQRAHVSVAAECLEAIHDSLGETEQVCEECELTFNAAMLRLLLLLLTPFSPAIPYLGSHTKTSPVQMYFFLATIFTIFSGKGK